jgi:hypothetical protein
MESEVFKGALSIPLRFTLSTDRHYAVHCQTHISTVASYLCVEFRCIESRGRQIYDHAESRLTFILSKIMFLKKSIQGGGTACP